jgi:hypothetical protein
MGAVVAATIQPRKSACQDHYAPRAEAVLSIVIRLAS